MATCQAVQANLTAWIDGELSAGWNDRIRQHVAACPACAGEAAGLRRSIEWQRCALPRVVALDDFSAAPLRARLQCALVAEPAESQPGWTWLIRPLAVAGGALAAATILLVLIAGGPKAVLIPLGVEPPPVAVTREPELFTDYPLIQHLDALENFDTVQSVPLDDDQASQRG